MPQDDDLHARRIEQALKQTQAQERLDSEADLRRQQQTDEAIVAALARENRTG